MESKKLIIGFVWTFVLAVLVIETLKSSSITFATYMVLFFIAIVSTIAVETMIPDKMQSRDERLGELREIKARLDDLMKGSN